MAKVALVYQNDFSPPITTSYKEFATHWLLNNSAELMNKFHCIYSIDSWIKTHGFVASPGPARRMGNDGPRPIIFVRISLPVPNINAWPEQVVVGVLLCPQHGNTMN